VQKEKKKFYRVRREKERRTHIHTDTLKKEKSSKENMARYLRALFHSEREGGSLVLSFRENERISFKTKQR
jgi:predicted transcriptional regulator